MSPTSIVPHQSYDQSTRLPTQVQTLPITLGKFWNDPYEYLDRKVGNERYQAPGTYLTVVHEHDRTYKELPDNLKYNQHYNTGR